MIARGNLFDQVDMTEHIRHSNLIEGVNDPFEDRLSALAWKYLAAQERISRPRILEVHRLITIWQLRIDQAGEWRRVDVVIRGPQGLVRRCPSPDMAFRMIWQWVEEMRDWHKLDPRQMHVKFEEAHPFVDGNGRTGRMLMWWHQMKLGQKPLLIPVDSRQEYYKWFKGGKRTL